MLHIRRNNCCCAIHMCTCILSAWPQGWAGNLICLCPSSFRSTGSFLLRVTGGTSVYDCGSFSKPRLWLLSKAVMVVHSTPIAPRWGCWNMDVPVPWKESWAVACRTQIMINIINGCSGEEFSLELWRAHSFLHLKLMTEIVTQTCRDTHHSIRHRRCIVLVQIGHPPVPFCEFYYGSTLLDTVGKGTSLFLVCA